MWEVQGHGTVTGAGDPRDGAARREILPPWVDIRLTFADGARIDVLAVVRDGRIAIEDAQADPPLALEGFAALAEAIEAPLHNACQVVAGPHRPPAPQPVDSAVPADTPVTPLAPGSVEGTQPLPEGPVSLEETKPEADSPAAHGSGPAPLGAEGPAEQPNTVRSAEEPAPERAPTPSRPRRRSPSRQSRRLTRKPPLSRPHRKPHGSRTDPAGTAPVRPSRAAAPRDRASPRSTAPPSRPARTRCSP